MDLKVKEATTSPELSDLIRLLNENTHYEHDCSREVYINHVVKNMYKTDNHRVSLLYVGDKAVGYIIVRFDNFIMKEFVVVDIYIGKAHQGNNYIDLLVNDIIPIAFKVGALRIKWQSGIFDTDFWDTHSFGVATESYKIFYVGLTDAAQETYDEVSK